MVAQHLSVIAGERDDGVVENTFFAQGSDDDSELVVDVGAKSIERAAGEINLVGQRAVDSPTLIASHPQRMRKRLKILRPVTHHRRIDRHIAIEIQVFT